MVPFTSWAQCNEPDQEKDNDNRYVCVNGCGSDSTGKCVPTSNCPSQNTGCSSYDVDSECLSYSNSANSVQPNKWSCVPGCRTGGVLCAFLHVHARIQPQK